ncbi:MAG: hypothetical protein KF802_12810 [Bdellovibrionaceae bacterium]|nr:hypothetical protein [Pseudobdellovibrionaceae bacterium]
MHFSCKITSAVLSYLEHRGEDLSSFYDPGFPAMEVLRDPSTWMSAPEMESFLETLVRMSWSRSDGSLLRDAGHASPGNHAWGVLDSVLRMMPKPREIFHQPERFLSYFISPEPPIENLRQSDASVSFDLPLPAEQYPHVTAFLKAAFESLPVYVGQGLAVCDWSEIHLKITWPTVQETLFEKDPGHQLSPELLKSVIADHQRLLRELEEKNLELQRKNEELRQLREDMAQPQAAVVLRNPEEVLSSLAIDSHSPAFTISQNLARLHDYFVRAQQLVVLLSGVARKEKEPAIKEALRRVDWEHVKSQYWRAISESVESLRRLQNRAPLKRLPPEEQPHV